VVVPSVQEAAPAEGVIVPNLNEAQGEIVPAGDGASKKPVVNPNAFVIRAASKRN
jgi:hypothetical protein